MPASPTLPQQWSLVGNILAAQDKVSAAALDAIIANVVASLNALRSDCAQVIRGDNLLADSVVTTRSLGLDVLTLLAAGRWQAKAPCKVAVVANVTISNPGTATFDGVALSNGDRIFLTAQTAAAENGIYVFNGSSSALTRAADANTAGLLDLAYALITQGAVYGGSAFLVQNATIVTVGTDALTVVQVTSAVVTAAGGTTGLSLASRFGQMLSPMDLGAVGDGVGDDTAAVSAAAALGVPIYLRGKNYRVRSQIVMASGCKFIGPGTITLDPAANVYSMLVTNGAEVAGLALTADLLRGTRVATLASTASFSVGQIVALRATSKFGGSYPYSSVEIISKTPTTLTFKQAATCDYLTTDTAVVVGMTMVTDVEMVDVKVVCASGSDINYPLRFNHAQRLKISRVVLLGHNVATTPTDAAGMVTTNFLDAEFDRCSVNATSVQSCGIEGYGGSDCRILGCDTANYDFGIEISLTSGAIMSANIQRSGVVRAGNRGMKIKGVWDATISGNEVVGFDTGMKLEESRCYTVVGNTFAYCGFDATANGINASNQVANAGQMGESTIASNTLRGLTGNGIFLDAGNSFVTVTGNTLEDLQGAGIYVQAPDCTISHNLIRDWGKAYVGSNDQNYAGINAPVTKVTIIGNRFNNAVLNTVPDVATTISDGTLVIDGNYSDTNNLLFFSSSNKPPLNGFKLGPTTFGVVDAARPYATAVGGCPQTKTVPDAGTFTFTKQDEGCFFIVTVATAGSALSGLFFCDTATGAVSLINDPSGNTFSITAATGSRCNVYKSAASNTITIENKLGSTKAIRVSIVGARLASVT